MSLVKPVIAGKQDVISQNRITTSILSFFHFQDIAEIKRILYTLLEIYTSDSRHQKDKV